jgi:integrase
MVSHARTLRDKAIVLTMASSGLAQREVRSLTLGNFYEGLDAETGITTLHLRRQKVRMDFITFISPEATRMIKDYLAARGIHGHRGGEDTGHLFATRTGSQISEGRFVDIFADTGKRAGYEKVSGTFSIVRPHALRKFFSSTLLNNGADLMGHRIDSTHEAYFRADPDKLKQRYMQYLPFLSLSETGVRTVESSEYHRLVAENEELRRALREMKRELESANAGKVREQRVV